MKLYSITPGFQIQQAAKSQTHGSHENQVLVALSNATAPQFASQKGHLAPQQNKPYLFPIQNTGFSIVG